MIVNRNQNEETNGEEQTANMTGVTITPIHRGNNVNTDNRTDRIDNIRRNNTENNNNNNENNIDNNENNNDNYANNNDNYEYNNDKNKDYDKVMAVTDDVIDVTENVTVVTQNVTSVTSSVTNENTENNNNNNENNIDNNENNNDNYENNNDNYENSNNNNKDYDKVLAVTDDVIDVTEIVTDVTPNVTAVTFSVTNEETKNLRPRRFLFLTDKNITKHVAHSTQKDVEKLSENDDNENKPNGQTMVNNWQNNGNNNGIQQHHANVRNDQLHAADNERTSTPNIVDVDKNEDEINFNDEINIDDEINIKFNTRAHATNHLTPTSSIFIPNRGPGKMKHADYVCVMMYRI